MTAHPPEIVELLACPFCGGRPYVIEDDSHGACGIGCHCDPEPYVDALVGHLDKAAALWNTRAFAPQPGEVELREALKPFAEFADWIAANKPGWDTDHHEVQQEGWPYTLGVAWFRRARAALKQEAKS